MKALLDASTHNVIANRNPKSPLEFELHCSDADVQLGGEHSRGEFRRVSIIDAVANLLSEPRAMKSEECAEVDDNLRDISMRRSLKKALIDSGKARYAVVNLPLAMHPEAIHAAEVAECAAEQGKYWEMHDALFARQPEIATADPALFAADLKLDIAGFNACLRADKALARVMADQKEAQRLNVSATPTLFLGRVRSDGGVDLLRQLNGALPVETFVAEVTKLIQG